jgi:arginine exporter protein ArgO
MIDPSVLAAAGLGLGLGLVTGMPLGVINVAIVEAASAGRRRFARGLGSGGGAADAIHAMLAFAGTGQLVTAEPALVRILAIGAAIAIIAYAARAWRRRHVVDHAPDRTASHAAALDPSPTGDPDRRAFARGLAAGFLLTLPNPAALAAWVAVAASVWPGAAPVEAAAVAGGVGAGSALWFALLARWIGRVGRARRAHPALQRVPQVALILLVAIAVAGVVRAL